MREIKYRAWDKSANKWLDMSLHYWLIDPGNGQPIRVHHSGQIEGPIENIILVQYTGLKSKNGKEIYEGDIIRYTFHIGPREWPGIVHEVEWSDSNLTGFHPFIDYDVDADGNECCVIPDSIEVIGNIYENPELLKK